MIFDSLNTNLSTNERDVFNFKESSKQAVLDVTNEWLTDGTITNSYHTPLSDGKLGNKNLTFTQYLEVVKGENESSLNQIEIDIAKNFETDSMSLHGNQLPLIREEFNGILNSETGNKLDKSVDSSDNNLNTKKGFTVNTETQVLFKEVSKENLLPKETLNKAFLAKENYHSNEKLISLDTSKASDNKHIENKLDLKVIDKEQLRFIQNIAADESSEVTKDSNILETKGIIQSSLFGANLTKVASKTRLVVDNGSLEKNLAVDYTNSDKSENSFLTQLNMNIKPIIETNLVPETMQFKQALNNNGQLANGLGVRIQWMLQQAMSSAEIMLDPPELGPLNVKLVQAGNETNIIFHVNTLQGKEAIEDNLTRLKQMLLSQGILLGDTEVQHKQKGDGASKEDNQQALSNNTSVEEIADSNLSDATLITDSNMNLLDTYI
jgi:hypothetical protein